MYVARVCVRRFFCPVVRATQHQLTRACKCTASIFGRPPIMTSCARRCTAVRDKDVAFVVVYIYAGAANNNTS
jgi:hypothetical protein